MTTRTILLVDDDDDLRQILVEQLSLDRTEIDLPLKGSGRFYVRLRARDPDGFIGPYTTPQSFDAPNCLRDGSGNCVRGGADGQPLQLTFQ